MSVAQSFGGSAHAGAAFGGGGAMGGAMGGAAGGSTRAGSNLGGLLLCKRTRRGLGSRITHTLVCSRSPPSLAFPAPAVHLVAQVVPLPPSPHVHRDVLVVTRVVHALVHGLAVLHRLPRLRFPSSELLDVLYKHRLGVRAVRLLGFRDVRRWIVPLPLRSAVVVVDAAAARADALDPRALAGERGLDIRPRRARRDGHVPPPGPEQVVEVVQGAFLPARRASRAFLRGHHRVAARDPQPLLFVFLLRVDASRASPVELLLLVDLLVPVISRRPRRKRRLPAHRRHQRVPRRLVRDDLEADLRRRRLDRGSILRR
mmetsp:Transcript_3239/g.14045  ORF Transcript_3239/g.14045 Transcript_3239/m.14045 type:complete len:315 (+) Transcript_3239:948-1892(+)